MRFLSSIFRRRPKTKPEPVKPTGPQLNQAGIDLMKYFESCLEPDGRGRFKAYADPARGWGVPTIGWGTVGYEDGSKVKRGDVITQARADELFEWESREKSKGVLALVTVPLNNNEFSALVSFSYNLGLGALKDSTLLRKLNAGDYFGAASEFPKWNKGRMPSGELKPMLGLTRRRVAEQRLFTSKIPFILPV